MRIAFVVHNLIRGNGQGRIQYEIVRYALARGHQVTLYADRVADELVREGAQWVQVRQKPRRPALVGEYTFASAADRAIAPHRARFDVICAAGFTMRGPHDVSLCQFVHAAWMQSPVHVSRVQGGPRAWYQAAYTRLNSKWERASFSAARVIVAPSEKIRRELTSVGIPTPVEVIYNGVDLNEFRPGAIDRASLDLPTGVPLALFVGDIRTPRKNLDSVLRAMVRVPQARLVVIGAVEGSPFPEMAKSLGVADRVYFQGFRNDVARYMQACDLFVFPSRYEAGTLVLLEAMASGLPVITARTAGGCEVMENGSGVVVEDPDDVNAIGNAMAKFLGSEEERKQASVAARRTAERYAWSAMASQYIDLFGRMVRTAVA